MDVNGATRSLYFAGFFNAISLKYGNVAAITEGSKSHKSLRIRSSQSGTDIGDTWWNLYKHITAFLRMCSFLCSRSLRIGSVTACTIVLFANLTTAVKAIHTSTQFMLWMSFCKDATNIIRNSD